MRSHQNFRVGLFAYNYFSLISLFDLLRRQVEEFFSISFREQFTNISPDAFDALQAFFGNRFCVGVRTVHNASNLKRFGISNKADARCVTCLQSENKNCRTTANVWRQKPMNSSRTVHLRAELFNKQAPSV